MNNPLSNGNFFGILKKNNKKNEITSTGSIECSLIGMNKAIDIVSEACACCWDKKVPDTYAERAEYVAKRTRTGHTSILEHSNFVVFLEIPEYYTESLLKYLSWCEYLHYHIYKNSDGKWNVLLGGTYRGFSNVYLNTDDLNNPVLKAVANTLYTYAPSAVFEDVCKYGFMEKDKFLDVEPDENFHIMTTHAYDGPTEDKEHPAKFKIIGLDNIKILYTSIYNVNKEFAESLTTYDMLNFVTVTVLFKNMSRIITQQLLRHRNGVTQESQRYVDYSKAMFNSPASIRPEKYDKNYKYKVKFGSSDIMEMNLQDIGDAICMLYGMLTDKDNGKNALLMEDARGYLPCNVQSRKVYMTFTYKKLFKFLQLREAAGAQAEIRQNAKDVGEYIRHTTDFNSKELTDLYTKPKLMIEDPFKIDIIEGEEEIVEKIDENTYIKAAGLNVDENKEEN